MISINQSRLIRSLHQKKYRQKYRKFTVEGEKMVLELLQELPETVEAIYGNERWANDNAASIRPFLNLFNEVREEDLKKLSALSTAPPVIAVANMRDESENVISGLDTGYSFYLDGLQDPGNLGTILRIADWFGFRAVVLSPDTTDPYNPKAVQASMGALFRMSVFEAHWTELLEVNPGLKLMGGVMNGKDVFGEQLPESGLIVIGNEGKGIHTDLENRLDFALTIPKGEGSRAESLNASVAAGIFAAVLSRK